MDAPNLLHLRPRHRLVVGDDRERLQRRARKASANDAVYRQVVGQVVRRAEAPATGDLYESDAARLVEGRERGELPFDIGALRHLRRERRGIDRPTGREDHGLHDAARVGRTLLVLGGLRGRQRLRLIDHGSCRLRRR